VTDEVYAPLAVCLLLAILAHWTSARLAPRSGTWIMAVSAAIGGLCTLWTLGLLSLSLVDDVPVLARDEGLELPVSDWVSLLALVALGGAVARIAVVLGRRRRWRRSLRVVLDLPGGELVVLPDRHARAFAVPGPLWTQSSTGRIVVTDTLLRALSPAQRRVLLAHERAHLEGAHALALGLAAFGAAANPLLIPAARATAFLSERHADEEAAAAVGDRRLAAEALAVAALAGVAQPSTLDTAPNFHHIGVVERVMALRTPNRPRRLGLVVALSAAVLAVFAVADATGDFALLVRAFLNS
jgi:Zn-dependent protease with chaperone function